MGRIDVKYRKRPVEVEVYQYHGDGFEALDWSGQVSQDSGTYLYIDNMFGMMIKTLEGTMHVSLGDFIICGVNGEFYPCKPDIFEKIYEKVEE